MLQRPSDKYCAFTPVGLPDRQWPNKTITQPPIWLSTDLRDGNQALIEPMTITKKLRFFDLLVRTGLKEIEIGFPSASQIEFDFVRILIDEDRIPDDVTIQVLTQSRDDLIARTMESLRGAKRACVHLYNATAPQFRRIVFNMEKKDVIGIAVKGTALIKKLAAEQPATDWSFEYSPETFTATELPFAKEVCEAVMDTWQPTPQKKMIFNLPATVELATPNHYADQIEWMHRNLSRRDCWILSVHPHNDRGTGIAAAELAQMAGAERVEGCLFGNGERTGNVDIVTLALNLYTQGIHSGLDFSDIEEVRQCVEYCNQIPVHPRHPYAGDLVFTAFSGSHQDAIKKGFAVQKSDAIWEVPYLPIDPADLGKNYEAVIRINSQSGKGGIAYLLEQEYGFTLPRRLQIEFSRVIQKFADASAQEISAADIYQAFHTEYLLRNVPYHYIGHHFFEDSTKPNAVELEVEIELNGKRQTIKGTGNGPIEAFIHGLGSAVRVLDYHEHSIGSGANASAVSYIEMRVDNETLFGVGIDANIVTASLKAILSGLNRAHSIVTKPTRVLLEN